LQAANSPKKQDLILLICRAAKSDFAYMDGSKINAAQSYVDGITITSQTSKSMKSTDFTTLKSMQGVTLLSR